MEERLRESYGLFLYEEDVMLLLAESGGMTLEEADELRRGIVESGGDTANLSPLRNAFLEAAGSAGRDLSLAGRAWSIAEKFAAYSFSKAHAASFAFLAYCSAYLKVHHPAEFACALLNHHQGLYPLRTEAAELARMGVKLLPAHVNLSGYRSTLQAGGVRVGLDKLKGLSRPAVEALLEERGRREFVSIPDLLQRVRLNNREVAALVLSGACDRLPPLTGPDYPYPHEAVLQALREGLAPEDLLSLPLPSPQAADRERVRLYRALTRVKNELRYLEMHLSFHPMALLREEAGRYGCRSIGKAASLRHDSAVRIAATVAAMRRVPTRQGPMMFLTLEDESGLLEAALLSAHFARLGESLTTAGPYLVEGRVKRVQGGIHLEVQWIAPFHRRRRPFGG